MSQHSPIPPFFRSEYLEEAVEWGHYPRLHRATDQVCNEIMLNKMAMIILIEWLATGADARACFK